MKPAKLFSTLPVLLLLAACSGNEALYTIPATPVEALPKQRIGFSSVEVASVSLPDYAGSGEIYRRQGDGSLKADKSKLWADDPARGMTMTLVRDLTGITGAQIAASPWPFLDRASARVEVRISEMVTEADGSFHLAGQYFVAPDSEARGRSGLFELEAPVAGENAAALAAARAQVMAELAALIAQKGLR
ncbi:PqiC family protein [Pseudooceanicola sp. CBS1P-1]|uniref:ABC-type transport auxiliary lipoprotein component domain-containing protein n=1 Tax=Pseudooceanicola albus TaxID=2692189 RepID=A0A6L7G712_9RHOB|nr:MULTISPECIES: ABC-type transport auxiliary lipoprotein family protein [Pseudooceanicola]MBT9384172.1 PqiC family protein [Pseudooceanicola endophyticus]MXN19729.1 hypothetical protein [Pseudooceanicola albus]